MAQATAEPQTPSFGRRLVRMVGIAVLCVAALVAGLAASLGPARIMDMVPGETVPPAPPAEEKAAAPAAADAEGHGKGPVGHIVVTPFKEIIVNVTATTASGRQTSRFLKLNLALVYDETIAGAANIEERKLFLRDSFQDYLRQLTEKDVHGSIGLVRLKAELLRRARAISDSAAPQEILISDLIIQ